jgi:hypothetical protein
MTVRAIISVYSATPTAVALAELIVRGALKRPGQDDEQAHQAVKALTALRECTLTTVIGHG